MRDPFSAADIRSRPGPAGAEARSPPHRRSFARRSTMHSEGAAALGGGGGMDDANGGGIVDEPTTATAAPPSSPPPLLTAGTESPPERGNAACDSTAVAAGPAPLGISMEETLATEGSLEALAAVLSPAKTTSASPFREKSLLAVSRCAPDVHAPLPKSPVWGMQNKCAAQRPCGLKSSGSYPLSPRPCGVASASLVPANPARSNPMGCQQRPPSLGRSVSTSNQGAQLQSLDRISCEQSTLL